MIVNSWYNGYSPKERDEKYKELKEEEKMSKVPKMAKTLQKVPKKGKKYNNRKIPESTTL